MFKRLAVAAALILLATQAYKLVSKKNEVALTDEESFEDSPKIKKNLQSKRTPASQNRAARSLNEGPSMLERARDAESFKSGEVSEGAFNSEEKTTAPAESVGYDSTPGTSGRRYPSSSSSSSLTDKGTQAKSGSTASSLPAGSTFLGGAALPNINSDTKPTPDADENDDDAPSSGGTGTVGPPAFACSADVGSGTFRDPISVSLTCNNIASLRYCLAEGACCDPESAATYMSPIPVGEGPKTYCLSFIGEDTKGNLSSIVQKTYTFNPGNPDLVVDHVQKFFQTTELSGLMSVASAEFSKNDYFLGVINTYTYDPHASGSALTTCEEIVNDFATVLPGPLSQQVIPETTLSGFSLNSQLDLFLGRSKIANGKNFVTTYIKNSAFDETYYSCSTTQIMREDFAYFDPSAAFTTTATTLDTPEIREFAGNFTPFGHFEPVAPLVRGPAGSAGAMVSNQKLEYGLFGIFY